jgi:predicted methyltransferase
MEANQKTMKAVYTVVERGPGKSYWTRVGVGFVNADGSINLKLDAVPVNGTLQVREWESQEEREQRFRAAGAKPFNGAHASDPISSLV